MAHAFLFKTWFIIKNLKNITTVAEFIEKKTHLLCLRISQDIETIDNDYLLFGETSLPQYKAT